MNNRVHHDAIFTAARDENLCTKHAVFYLVLMLSFEGHVSALHKVMKFATTLGSYC